MTPTNKGNYSYCENCAFYIRKPFDISSEKYPCYYSHRDVRGDVKYERDFKECILFRPSDEDIVSYTNLF